MLLVQRGWQRLLEDPVGGSEEEEAVEDLEAVLLAVAEEEVVAAAGHLGGLPDVLLADPEVGH